MKYLLALLLSLPVSVSGSEIITPRDPAHPGSKNYSFEFEIRNLSCQGREVSLILPKGQGGPFPAVVFGHGQALGLSAYRATFEHLAKKGVAVIFPAYDTGFFDQNWNRMGSDFVSLSQCALAQHDQLDPSKMVYSGHSKGAYVASIAAGLANAGRSSSAPKAIILLNPAGYDPKTLQQISPDTALTVVFSDKDTIVSRNISEEIFAKAASKKRQFIFLRSYPTSPAIAADHMWPLTEKNFFGGGPEGPLHYHGSWKWLVAGAQDLSGPNPYTNPYLYGNLAAEKGVDGLLDEVKRNF